MLLWFLLPALLVYMHVYECTLSSLHEFGETGKWSMQKIPCSLLLNYLVVRPGIQQFKQITEMWIIHYMRMNDSSCSSLLFLTALSSMRDKDIGIITTCRDGVIDPTCPYCLVSVFFLLKHSRSSNMYCPATSFFMVARMFVSTVVIFPFVTFWCAFLSRMCQQYSKVF